MFIHEMTEGECRAALERGSFGRLACAKDNEPYVLPIYFSYDGRHLYGFSTLGQKIEWMRSNPLVCLEIDETDEPPSMDERCRFWSLRGATGYARIWG